MLMSLGMFIFSMQTAPFEKLQRATKQRWAANNRVGHRPASQHLGPGNDSITLTGTLAPQLTGGAENLDKLRTMMATGKAWILVTGTGKVMGLFYIESIDETRTHLIDNGQAQKIDFTVKLERYGGDDPAQLGLLTP